MTRKEWRDKFTRETGFKTYVGTVTGNKILAQAALAGVGVDDVEFIKVRLLWGDTEYTTDVDAQFGAYIGRAHGVAIRMRRKPSA